MWNRTILFSLLLYLCFGCQSPVPPTVWDDVFAEGSGLFHEVISEKEKFEVQILFSPITRSGDSIRIEDHFFNFRPDEYFYPASTVKMPVAFLALQKLEELRSYGIDIDRDTPFQIDSLRPIQTPVLSDSTSQGGLPTIGHYIEKVFATSDNDAYNRLFEFTSQDYINSHLKNKRIFTNSRIIHRVGVSGFTFDENRYSPSFRFLDHGGKEKYAHPKTYAQSNHILPISNTQKGKGYISDNQMLVEEPFDFGQKNFINIKDLQESLKRVVFPELFTDLDRYGIRENDRLFVLETMGRLPRHHSYLKSDSEKYPDNYNKFLLFGDSKDQIPEHIIIRNKVGYAYGYLTDCAYIIDTKENVEYFLTATIHVNENKIYNDGIYEYEEIGIPFLAELGRLTHQYLINQNND